jgi:hypothetical protein
VLLVLHQQLPMKKSQDFLLYQLHCVKRDLWVSSVNWQVIMMTWRVCNSLSHHLLGDWVFKLYKI